jgi:sugar lactone lactonase YvrE
VTYGRDVKGRYGVFRIDGEDGDVTLLQLRGPDGRAGQEGFFFSPDGTRMYYRVATGGLGWICERDMTTGAERTIVDGRFRSMALSPDGRWFALMRPVDPDAFADSGAGPSDLVIVPVAAGGEARELLQDALLSTVEWAHDGQSLYVSRRLERGSGLSSWRVPIDGEAPTQAAIALDVPFHISPDGRQIAYESGESHSEVLVLENVASRLMGR